MSINYKKESSEKTQRIKNIFHVSVGKHWKQIPTTGQNVTQMLTSLSNVNIFNGVTFADFLRFERGTSALQTCTLRLFASCTAIEQVQKYINPIALLKSFSTSISLQKYSLHNIRKSSQAYFSFARMPGFLFFSEKDRTHLLACLLASIQPRTSSQKFGLPACCKRKMPAVRCDPTVS